MIIFKSVPCKLNLFPKEVIFSKMLRDRELVNSFHNLYIWGLKLEFLGEHCFELLPKSLKSLYLTL